MLWVKQSEIEKILTIWFVYFSRAKYDHLLAYNNWYNVFWLEKIWKVVICIGLSVKTWNIKKQHMFSILSKIAFTFFYQIKRNKFHYSQYIKIHLIVASKFFYRIDRSDLHYFWYINIFLFGLYAISQSI